MTTLKDIAKEAGVSVMTVSRVVNGYQSKVSKETKQKILDIINKSGYVPNSSARSLSSKSSHIVSIIMRGEGNTLKEAYNATMLGNITQCVQIHDYYIMLHFINDYNDITRRLRAWNAEGAIFLGMFDKDVVKIQEDNQIPLVFIDSYSPLRQITNVGIDDYKGGVLAAKHFIEKGHRKFAFVGPELDFSGVAQQRLQGYRDTILKNGLLLRKEHILSIDNSTNITDKILDLKDTVTAIFVTSDLIAIQLIDDLNNKGYNVPEQFSIIGFDNLPLSYYITPKLTTIAQDINKKAQLASDILFRHMKDCSIHAESINLDVQLIERDSVRTILR